MLPREMLYDVGLPLVLPVQDSFTDPFPAVAVRLVGPLGTEAVAGVTVIWSTRETPLSETASMLMEFMLRDFVSSELMPLERIVQEREAARGLGNDPLIPPDDHDRLLKRARDLDLWGLDVPEEYGGQGY